MNADKPFASKIKSNDFIITAEYLPAAAADFSNVTKISKTFGGVSAVNVADNPFGVTTSSLATSAALVQAGIEPIYQLVTRDRNRIAIQSDLLGAAALGINNILCLSGYHQTLGASSQSSNVYDIDSIQLTALVKKMNEDNKLLDGTKIDGAFFMTAGSVANPYLAPVELNLIRVAKKVEAGAAFLQTQAVFDIDGIKKWLESAATQGITERTAILAGVMPLKSAEEAEKLRATFTDFHIPDEIIARMRKAGDETAQKKEGVTICIEIIKKVKEVQGIRGVHITAGGNESVVPEILSGAEL